MNGQPNELTDKRRDRLPENTKPLLTLLDGNSIKIKTLSDKYVHLQERPYIHTCRSYVHMLLDFTNAVSLAWHLARMLT